MTIKMLQMEDSEYFEDGNIDETFVGKIQTHSEEKLSTDLNNFQIHKMKENLNPITMNINVNVDSPPAADAELSDSSITNSGQSPSILAQGIHISDKCSPAQPLQLSAMEAAVNKLQERRASWNQNGVRRENSPMVFVTIINRRG